MLVYNERLGVHTLNTTVGKGKSCKLCPLGKGCYSKRNWSTTSASKRLWANNSKRLKTREGQFELALDILRQKHVRLFSAGDIQSIRDAKRMLTVAKAVPNERVWMSTASWRVMGVLPYLAKIRDAAPGWCVRLSSGTNPFEELPDGFRKSCVIGVKEQPSEIMTLCRKSRGSDLYDDKSACVKCGYVCWDNNIELVAHRKH
jgi:hypothetical protein